MGSVLAGLGATVTRWWKRGCECTRAEVALPRGTLWSRSVRSGGLTLTCHEGWLWLTCEGDATDHVLTAGRSVRLSTRGLVVVQALRTARFSLGWEPLSPAAVPHTSRVAGR